MVAVCMQMRCDMKRATRIIQISLALALSTGCEALGQAVPRETVIVVPEETDELLGNPGMGWQTFHRTRDKDENLPGWIPSTVQYARWGWGTLEPRPGEIDYAFLDEVLAQSRWHARSWRFASCAARPRGGGLTIRIGLRASEARCS